MLSSLLSFCAVLLLCRMFPKATCCFCTVLFLCHVVPQSNVFVQIFGGRSYAFFAVKFVLNVFACIMFPQSNAFLQALGMLSSLLSSQKNRIKLLRLTSLEKAFPSMPTVYFGL